MTYKKTANDSTRKSRDSQDVAKVINTKGGMITQKQLGELAGVSITTIQNVIHHKGFVGKKKLNHIYDLMDEYDYHPNQVARAMVRGKTDSLGIMVPTIEVRLNSQNIVIVNVCEKEKEDVLCLKVKFL